VSEESQTNGRPLLSVENLETSFFLSKGVLKAVNNVSFQLGESETLGIVGETGCGKSVTALSILKLVPNPPGRIIGGRVVFEGEDLIPKSEHQMRSIRGRKISMVFQEPMTALNPSFTIGDQISECFRVHQGLNKAEAKERTLEMLSVVRIRSPQEMFKSYPYEFSGGMRQRAMIAMALSCQPKLVIADEPTTALDVTIQAKILDLLEEMIDKFKMSLIFISHNLGIVARLCQKIAVMYAGGVVEMADRFSLFENPLHPYTVGLLNSIPRRGQKRDSLDPIAGSICDLLRPPSGCRFNPRCPKVMDVCSTAVPPLVEVEPGHYVSCYLYPH
jgi:oligopeptide/dipeptide ABC transporter ATP-binding protein